MNDSKKILELAPVLPSSNIKRDVTWYKERVGFEALFYDNYYAVIKRDSFHIHLQWHAGTADDPLLGGSVLKIFIKDIEAYFQEFIDRKTIKNNSLRLQTDWGTNEFGFFDLNNNAIFFVEDII